jgi:hypothetical protein
MGSPFFQGMSGSFTALCPKSVTDVLNLKCYLCSEPHPPAVEWAGLRFKPGDTDVPHRANTPY